MPNPPLPPLPPPVVLPAVLPDLESEDIDDLGLMTREEMLTSQQLQFMVRVIFFFPPRVRDSSEPFSSPYLRPVDAAAIMHIFQHCVSPTSYNQ